MKYEREVRTTKQINEFASITTIRLKTRRGREVASRIKTTRLIGRDTRVRSTLRDDIDGPRAIVPFPSTVVTHLKAGRFGIFWWPVAGARKQLRIQRDYILNELANINKRQLNK